MEHQIINKLNQHDTEFKKIGERLDQEHSLSIGSLQTEVHRRGLVQEEKREMTRQILDLVKIIHERQSDYIASKERLDNHEHRISALEASCAK